MSTPYTIGPARYAGRWNGKPQMAVQCLSDKTGLKTRAMRLIGDGLKARYSNRENAYHARLSATLPFLDPAECSKLDRMNAVIRATCIRQAGLEAVRKELEK